MHPHDNGSRLDGYYDQVGTFVAVAVALNVSPSKKALEVGRAAPHGAGGGVQQGAVVLESAHRWGPSRRS